LLRKLAVSRPNRLWAADMMYIPTARGFVYLLAIIGWCSRRLLSWRVSITLDADFCIEALEEALARFEKPDIFGDPNSSLRCRMQHFSIMPLLAAA